MFRGRPIGLQIWALLFIPGGLIAATSFLYGTFLARNAYRDHGPALALIRAQNWYAMSTILFVLLVVFFVYRLLTALQRIEVYEQGILQRTKLFRKLNYRWGEISGISSSATAIMLLNKNIRTLPRGILFLNSGRTINLTNQITNLPRLVKIVKSKIYPIIWPMLKSDFHSGKLIQFGRLKLDSTNLILSRTKIPWSSVRQIGFIEGYLVIELRDDSTFRTPVSTLRNPELLLKLINWGIGIGA